MASFYSFKNQNSSYQGNCQWLFDQGKGNLVWVRREFELSELELAEKKWLKSGVKSKGIQSRQTAYYSSC